jgi:hypothetical protein
MRQIEDYADQLYEENCRRGERQGFFGFPLMALALQDRMELKVYGAKCILRVCTEAGMCRTCPDFSLWF